MNRNATGCNKQIMNKKENHSAKSEIEQAFLRLMTQKSYMDITVTDIVQEANVARVSFYRNFASISEVLDSIADATAEKLNIEFLPLLDTSDERKLREYLFNYFYQISLNYKEMWAIRGLNMDLFTKRLGEKIHEKRKAVESADSDISEKYGWVVKLCVLDGVSRRWIMDEMKETPEEIIDYVMPIIKTLLKQNTKEEVIMKKTGIMTDSHSGILNEEAERLGIKVLPMPFYIEEKVYREGVDLSREEFYDMLRKGTDVSTSQPSLVDVAEMWKEMLKEYEEIVYIPLSSALSGSCMAAMAMANEDEFAGKVFVVDNGRVATPMHRSVLDAVEMTEKGYSAAEIKKILEETREKMTIYIGLSTLEYLKKGGRVSSVTALAADVLNIKPVMHFSTGTLDTYQKCRGMKKARKVMIDAMKHELETNFREEYEAGNVYLMAASSSTDEVTAEWMAQIKESFPGMDVMCDKLSFGLSCHIGPDGLGIGCTCKPVE